MHVCQLTLSLLRGGICGEKLGFLCHLKHDLFVRFPYVASFGKTRILFINLPGCLVGTGTVSWALTTPWVP